MNINDQILNLIIDPLESKFTAVTETNFYEIKKLISRNEFPNAATSNGKSIILELCPRGQRDLAKDLSRKVKKLNISEASTIGSYKVVQHIISLAYCNNEREL